jgi:hypothetical protein
MMMSQRHQNQKCRRKKKKKKEDWCGSLSSLGRFFAVVNGEMGEEEDLGVNLLSTETTKLRLENHGSSCSSSSSSSSSCSGLSDVNN